MIERKDIDRLFQEKFKDFEQAPSPDMWSRIETELKKDQKKKRIVPIWWKLGGVAALLLLFLSIGGTWWGSWNSEELDIPIVDSNSIESKNSNSSFDVLIQPQDKEQLVESSERENTNISDTKRTPLKSEQRHDVIKSANSEVTNNSNYNSKRNASKKNMSYKTSPSVFPNRPERDYYVLNSYLNSSKPQLHSVESPSATFVHPFYKADEILENEELNRNQTIEEAIAQAEALEAPLDKPETPKQRWSVTPVVAPVYSMGLDEGSPIHSQFNSNSKSSDVTLSFGVGGSYAVTKRLKIRAGVNRVDFSNTTNDVMAFSAVGGSTQPSELALATVKLNANSNVYLMSASPLMKDTNSGLITSMQDDLGQLVMDYGFIELPIALEYRVLDQKFGVNVIGGFSTFFLNNNQISTIFNGENVVIGESSNLNNTSYSANFGIGLDYGITKQLNVMLEPMLKYQFNTFNRTFGNVQPMFIGVYTGLNFKF